MSRKPRGSVTRVNHSIRRHRVPTRKHRLGVVKGLPPLRFFNAFGNAKREFVKKVNPLLPVHRALNRIEHKSGLQRLRRASPLTKMRVCIARAKRKAVLFATKKAGLGKAIRTQKHFTKDSNVSC